MSALCYQKGYIVSRTFTHLVFLSALASSLVINSDAKTRAYDNSKAAVPSYAICNKIKRTNFNFDQMHMLKVCILKSTLMSCVIVK